jgi:branched-chain amino acid transport system ATP-binding protein
MVERVADLLRAIAEREISILLVEQKLAIAIHISHRAYVMDHGRMVLESTPSQLRAHPSIGQTWLEV